MQEVCLGYWCLPIAIIVYFCSSLQSTLEKHRFVGGLCTHRILRRWMQGFWSNEYLKNYLFSSLLEKLILGGFEGIFPASLSNFNMNFSLLSELLLFADWSACEQNHLFKRTHHLDSKCHSLTFVWTISLFLHFRHFCSLLPFVVNSDTSYEIWDIYLNIGIRFLDFLCLLSFMKDLP